MKEKFMALLFAVIILIVFAYMARTNMNGRFKYNDLYRMCIKNEANYTLTTPEYTTEITETTTSAATKPSTIAMSTESTTMYESTVTVDETSTTSLTQSGRQLTYSEILPSTIAPTRPKWTSSSRQSRSIATSTIMERRSNISSCVNKTTRLISTDSIYSTDTRSATNTTAPVETSSEISSEISSKMTSTVETTDKSTSSMLSSIAPPPSISSVSPPSVSSIIPPTALPTQTSTTFNLTTFDSTITTIPSTETEATSVNTIQSTRAIINKCSGSITTSFNHVVRYAVTNVACILIDMKMWINLQYAMDGSQTGKATLIVPTKVRTTGDCHEKSGEMTLSWNETRNDSGDKENRIVLHYTHNDVIFFLDSIFVDVHLDSKNFPRAQQRRISGGGRGLKLFYAPVKDGIFTCMVDTTINVGNQITAVISEIRLIAFNNCDTSCWKTENNCIYKININVSAIIGATIIGILVVLVVFYLIWRKRRNLTIFRN